MIPCRADGETTAGHDQEIWRKLGKREAAEDLLGVPDFSKLILSEFERVCFGQHGATIYVGKQLPDEVYNFSEALEPQQFPFDVELKA